MRPLAWQALAIAALAEVAPVRADSPPPSPCTRGSHPALTEIACEIARTLGERARGALVVGAEPEAESGARPNVALGLRVAELVAGALGPGASAAGVTRGALGARALAEGTRPVVSVLARLRSERLEVTADVFLGRARFWQWVRGAASAPIGHAFAERALDGEVRSFLTPVPLVAREVVGARGSDPDVVAVACGDMDGDGAAEIALAGRRRISLGRVRAGAFAPFAERAWGELVAVAPDPLREPIGSAWIPAPGVLELGSSDRAHAVRLDARLEKLEDLAPRMPWPGGGCAGLAELAVSPRIERCTARDVAGAGTVLGDALDAFAGATVVSARGEARLVRAGRRAGTGIVTLADGARAAHVEGAGAQLALGDLDGDGSPELVTSLDVSDPKQDAVVVYSWPPGREPVERFRVAVPGGVRALGVCPPRAAAMAPIVVGSANAVWVIR